MTASFNKLRARLHDGRILTVDDWSVSDCETWGIIGTNGSGKTVLSRLFAGEVRLSNGDVSGLPDDVLYVSLEAQREIIERERHEDESDLMDRLDVGTLVSELLHPVEEVQEWIDKLRLGHLLEQGFRSLSTGESRKVLLVNAIRKKPELLILDEPLEGLDADSRTLLEQALAELHASGQRILWVANRLDELPSWVDHLAFVHGACLLVQGGREEVLNAPEVHSLIHFDKPLADFPAPVTDYGLSDNKPLVTMVNTSIQYGERMLFEGLNWSVEPGQHWAVTGPNGSGKTSLLQLITGDNPQCYRNELYLFGMKRGSGETIWDIKKHIGLVSSSLQWEYRATTNVLTTVISGLYDSIGLYQAAGDGDRRLAEQWLEIVGLHHKANQSLHHLSYGEQRLVLIARALIKQPPLLILDEPCQGLDDPSREMVLAFIRRLSEQQRITLLYVTHHAAEIPAGVSHHLRLGTDTLQGFEIL